MPPVAPTNKLILPQIPKPLHARPQIRHHHHAMGSGYSGLPSLSHSMKVPTHLSAFPSLLASENPSGKVMKKQTK